MTVKIIKRLNEDARVAHQLLREMLVYCFGYTDVFSDDDGTGAFTPDDSGVDGETDMTTPQIFSAVSGAFTTADIGKYLVLYGVTSANIVGVHKIVGVPSGTTLSVRSGIYGSSFSTATGISWRLMDPALAVAGAAPEFVVQALSGTDPLWQAKFAIGTLDSDLIRITVGPFGGYVDPTWTLGSTAEVVVNSDTTPMWYFLVDNAYIRIWTEDNAGTAVHNLGYAGAGFTRRAAYDPNFACCFGGAPLTALANVECLGSDDATGVTYSAIVFGDSTANNMFTSLPGSEFDFRNDAADIPVGSNDGALPEADRGTLLGLQWVSNQLAYRQFVDNGRQLLCLGLGIAVTWDSSLAR